MKVEFQKNEQGVKLLAIYLSQLAREGVAYQVDNKTTSYEVVITGF
jgi:hypothetical protein